MKIQSNYNYSNYNKPTFKGKLAKDTETLDIIQEIINKHDFAELYLNHLKRRIKNLPKRNIFRIKKTESHTPTSNKFEYKVINEGTNMTSTIFEGAPNTSGKIVYTDERSNGIRTTNLAQAIYQAILLQDKLGALICDYARAKQLNYIEPDIKQLYSRKDAEILASVLSNHKMTDIMKKEAYKLLQIIKGDPSISKSTRLYVNNLLSMHKKLIEGLQA